ncbi:MAG TPA: hypothetical protein PLV70_08510 [Flavobacteriales bacterium]|nr:hypothetical protein [Flavobacteriales bacterium]HRP81301.1 hypothetical protein [Flavobacteriales bacterium]HRQ85137.1 hypothetical protein [Flavobacteriales bacterium]
MQKRFLLSSICAALAIASIAQTECTEYWKNAPRASDVRFAVNGQSRAASVQVGVPTELNIIIYKGQDYRVSFVYDEKILGDHVVARIIEKVRGPIKKAAGNGVQTKGQQAKPQFEDIEKVIWDNQAHDMADAVEFTATSTKRIAIEVTAPGVPEDPKNTKRSKAQPDIGCLGILIEHMPTPNVGF